MTKRKIFAAWGAECTSAVLVASALVGCAGSPPPAPTAPAAAPGQDEQDRHYAKPRGTNEAPGTSVKLAASGAKRFQGFRGCFTARELGTGKTIEYGGEECETRTLPASTFKIPNALIGLDTGVVADETTTFRWDGKPTWNPQWHRDHTLASALRFSVVWYFQRIAEGVGAPRYREYLAKMHYGNEDVSGPVTEFWLNGTLQISPHEQTKFLEALYDGSLPVSPRASKIVRGVLELRGQTAADLRERLPFVDRIPSNVVVSGKTGTGDKRSSGGEAVGWFVGAVEGAKARYVFACRARSNEAEASGAMAARIAYEMLDEEGILASAASKP